MSLWEAQMLQAKGRLILNRPFPAWLRQAAATAVAQLLPLDAEVVIAVDALRSTHFTAIRASGLVPIWEAGR